LNANIQIRIDFEIIEDLLACLQEGARLPAEHYAAGVPIVGFGLVCGRIHIDLSEAASEDGLYSLKDGEDSLRRIGK
jgi:hypothetical protein